MPENITRGRGRPRKVTPDAVEQYEQVNKLNDEKKTQALLNQYTDLSGKLTPDPFKDGLKDFAEKAGKKATEFNDSWTVRKEKALEKDLKGVSGSDRVRIGDSYNNSALLIGPNSDTFGKFDTYSMYDNLYRWDLWLSLYMTSWPFRKIIDQTSADLVNHGIKIKMPTEQNIITTVFPEEQPNGRIRIRRNHRYEDKVSSDQLADMYDAYELQLPELNKLAAWGKLFGGAVSVMLLSSEENTEANTSKELPEDFEGGIIRLYTVDRYKGVSPSIELVGDLRSPDYGQPKYYTVSLTNGMVRRFHHTRVLRYRGRPAPTLIEQALGGWGVPEGLHMFGELGRDEKIKASITSLLSKYTLEVIKMEGMRAFMNGSLSDSARAQLDSRLEAVNRYRSFNSLVFLDKEDEYIRHEGSSMTGLADLLDKNKSMVAGAANMPMVLLYGDQQKGLSGNSFDDMQLYDQRIQGDKNGEWRAVIQKLLTALGRQAGVQGIESWKFTFNSIIPEDRTKIVAASRDILNLYKELESAGWYTKEMSIRELKGFGDGIIFGSELTDEIVDEIIDQGGDELKESNGGSSSGPNNVPDTEGISPDEFEIDDSPSLDDEIISGMEGDE